MIGLPLDENFRSNKRKSIIIGSVVFVALLVTLFSTNLFNYLKIVTTPIPKKVHYVHSTNQLLQNLIIRTIQLCWKFCTIKIQKESIKRLAGAIQVDTQVLINNLLLMMLHKYGQNLLNSMIIWNKLSHWFTKLESYQS